MEYRITKSSKKGVRKILRICVSLLLLFTFTISKLPAQDGGPSLEHLKKNVAEGSKEVSKIKEEERRKEILSYVFMSVGFSVVIGIAWFTTVLARKRSKKEAEIKQKFILKQQELRKHHGHLHKARR